MKTKNTKFIPLTKTAIDKLPLPEGKYRSVYYFSDQRGLSLRVTSNGVKTFQVFKHIATGIAPYRKALGRYPNIAPAKAKNMAIEELGLLAGGVDPRIKRQARARKQMKFGELFDRYINEYAKSHVKTWQAMQDDYRRYFEDTWHAQHVTEIKHTDVQAWVDKLGSEVGKPTANKSFETFRAVFRRAIKKQIIRIEHDPTLGITLFKEKGRERFLMPDEFAVFKKALNKEPSQLMRDFFWMCLYTGMRQGNVMAMRFDQISWDLKQWRIPDTKNDDSQIVNLIPEAMKILTQRWDDRLSDEWVFPSGSVGSRSSKTGHLQECKQAWKRILLRAKEIDPNTVLYSEDRNKRLRPHDLRRTVGSYMAIQGVDSKVIGKALGHRSSAATAIYARLTQDPVRTALENAAGALGDVDKLLNRQEQDPVPVKRK